MVSEIVVENGTKIITLKTIIDIKNHYTKPVNVFRFDGKNGWPKVGRIEPNQTFNVPLEAVYSKPYEFSFQICGECKFNRSWCISTAPNTTKLFLIIFKLIEQSDMVILSCLSKKNRNLNLRKKKLSLLLKVAFSSHKYPQTSLFSNKVNFLPFGESTFFPRVQFSIFLHEATQNDHIRLLYMFENDKKKFGCVGSGGYAPASVNK